MSVLCLICKEKLISFSPSGLGAGSLEQFVENVVIATGCGHLYHSECLQSWFRTQNLKQKQTIPVGSEKNMCPSCHTRVREEDYRRIHLFEDHAEALEKAKLIEKFENLEIYCHQIEIQLQQLQRENDIMVNKILTPPTSPLEDYDTIVKNDRVKWIRKGEEPLAGVVLSIFKKEGKLCAKIRLDTKIRTTQRSNRLFSSFRSDKKQEVTVPFDEMVLEKDVNVKVLMGSNNNGGLNHHHHHPHAHSHSSLPLTHMSAYGKSLSSANIYPLFQNNNSNTPVNMRNSTLSLPGESRGLFGIRESLNESTTSIDMDNDNRSNHLGTQSSPATTTKRPSLGRSVSYSPGFSGGGDAPSINGNGNNRYIERDRPSSAVVQSGSNTSLDQERDYVVITPPWMRNKQQAKQLESKSSPPDNKNKHVTFADDHAVSKFTFTVTSGNSNMGSALPKVSEFGESLSSINSDTPYVNYPLSSVTDIISVCSQHHEKRPEPSIDIFAPPTPPPRPKIAIGPNPVQRHSSSTSDDVPGNNFEPYSLQSTPTLTPPPMDTTFFPVVSQNQSKAPISSVSESISGIFEEMDETFSLDNNGDTDCFGVTLLSLLYNSNGFDQHMLMDNVQDNEFCRTVKWIIRERFALPLRQSVSVHPDFAFLLKDALAHLCSGTLDVEELLTILFEFTYKMSPFINYSLEMCDYLHQFFIDFTDKSRIRSIYDLLDKSLKLQDSLKMEDTPEPALILQMPHSDDGILHYEFVIPNLTMVVDELIDSKNDYSRKCYCDNVATLQCKICTEVHGNSAILFCEQCKDLLEGVHMNTDHDLEITEINPTMQLPSTTLALSAIICWKNNQYSVFLKDGRETYSPWIYVHAISNGQLKIKELSGFGYWLESLLDNEKETNLHEIPPLLQKVLRHCRVLFYVPVRSSEV